MRYCFLGELDWRGLGPGFLPAPETSVEAISAGIGASMARREKRVAQMRSWGGVESEVNKSSWRWCRWQLRADIKPTWRPRFPLAFSFFRKTSFLFADSEESLDTEYVNWPSSPLLKRYWVFGLSYITLPDLTLASVSNGRQHIQYRGLVKNIILRVTDIFQILLWDHLVIFLRPFYDLQFLWRLK